MKTLKTSFRLLLFVTFFSGIIFRVYAQSESAPQNHRNSQKPSIYWIGQFPSGEKAIKTPNIFLRLFASFVGKKNPRLIRPFSVFMDRSDQLWVLDQGSHSVDRIRIGVGEITQLRRTKSTGFPSLVGICAAANGSVLFTDSKLNKIFLITKNSNSLQNLNTSTSLNRPTGIAYSQINKEIWVVETSAHRIAVLNNDGKLLRHVGHRGTGPGEFNYPTFIWIDHSGIVYVVDSMNFRIQILNEAGDVISIFGESGDATGYFSHPKGIATDSQQHIYVVDARANRVQIFDKEGNFLFYFGEQGTGKGEFWLPVGIYIDERDRIYVADSYNARIQIFQYKPGAINEK